MSSSLASSLLPRWILEVWVGLLPRGSRWWVHVILGLAAFCIGNGEGGGDVE